MPKIPDFSKFDLQSIVNSVKSMINPEIKVPEGDFIGAKIVEVTKLIQDVSNMHAQAAKDLNKVNDILTSLYRELEVFRKQSMEQQAAGTTPSSGTTTQQTTASKSSGQQSTTSTMGGQKTSSSTGPASTGSASTESPKTTGSKDQTSQPTSGAGSEQSSTSATTESINKKESEKGQE